MSALCVTEREAGVNELGEAFPAVLAAAVAGDPDAFARLWRATHPLLLRYLRVTAGDAAEDIASETWMKAIRSLGSFSGDEQSFRAWLTVVARNTARDQARAAIRRPETPAAELPPTREAGADAADEALERLGTERALRLVATLPPAQAEMVALRVVVGLEPAEVARITGRSPGAVRVAVHRALATLATRLSGHASDRVTDVTAAEREALTRRHG
jgi:RNA polymerase sigma-70 factor (ECF subfamily)